MQQTTIAMFKLDVSGKVKFLHLVKLNCPISCMQNQHDGITGKCICKTVHRICFALYTVSQKKTFLFVDNKYFFSFNFSSVVVCIFHFYCSVFLVFVLPSGVIKNDNFCKCCLIVIILSLLQTEINCDQV